MEIELFDRAQTGAGQDDRRIACQPRAGDAILHDIKGFNH
jgi:hypothetical protein